MSRVLNAMNKLNPTARTENGAVSHATTGFLKGSACLDYFSKVGTYVKRPQSVVDLDMVKIFSDDPELAIKIVFGTRLITRKPNGLPQALDSEPGVVELAPEYENQTGFGRKDEFYKAVLWMLRNENTRLYKNLHLIPLFGCWKDFLSEPLLSNIPVTWVYKLCKDNLDSQLLRKYLPQIRSKGNVRTPRDGMRSSWAKGFAKYLGISEQDYRKLKSQGAAHVWQRQMGRGEWDKIHFNGIPGRAMKKHVTQTGRDKKTVFERHDQIERLGEWLLKQKMVKFTGYPYELTKEAMNGPSLIQKLMLDKQFETIIDPMRGHKLGNVLPVLDTSGSMGCEVVQGVTAMDICMSMGVAFSMMNTGWFRDTVCMFDNTSRIQKLAGGMCDRVQMIPRNAMGGTNFQSVIEELIRVRKKNPEIPVEEYPDTLLVVSDMQFNPAGKNVKTNYEYAMKQLNSVGLRDMRFIWWFVSGRGNDFPVTMDQKGCYIIGGFDPVNIKALMGLSQPAVAGMPDAVPSVGLVEHKTVATEKKQETPMDGMLNFLSQPIFKLVK